MLVIVINRYLMESPIYGNPIDLPQIIIQSSFDQSELGRLSADELELDLGPQKLPKSLMGWQWDDHGII